MINTIPGGANISTTQQDKTENDRNCETGRAFQDTYLDHCSGIEGSGKIHS